MMVRKDKTLFTQKKLREYQLEHRNEFDDPAGGSMIIPYVGVDGRNIVRMVMRTAWSSVRWSVWTPRQP